MEDLHYLLTFNHCNQKRCAVLFGDLTNKTKFQVHKKLENTMINAPTEIKNMMDIVENQKLRKTMKPENEKFVYKLLEHLDPKVDYW